LNYILKLILFFLTNIFTGIDGYLVV